MTAKAFIAGMLSIVASAAMISGAHAADFAHLRGLAGQYTEFVLADPALDAELHVILGDDYANFMSVMQVTLPTRLIGDRYLVAEGCRAHDCGNQGGLVVIDLVDGTVTALRRGLYGQLITPVSDLDAAIANWWGQQ